jgi:hypothetical protein
MAYWWVSQNKTYRQERDGGYLWAPKRDANGRRQFHWETMTRVQPGDLIFSFAQQAIGAVGVATSAARDAQQPSELNNEWDNDGWRVDVEYQPVKPAVALSSFVSELVPLLPDRYSPLSEKKSGNQGYLFELPPEAGRLVAERVGGVAPVEEIVERIIARSVPDQTTRDALVKARVGQGGWRTDLLRYWRGQCAITGLTVEPLLRASHIKPWRDSDNAERLDVFNGLLLGAAYDAAFDAGLIAFDDDGRIVISTSVADEQREAAGLDPGATLRAITDRHRSYLAYYRVTLFEKARTL